MKIVRRTILCLLIVTLTSSYIFPTCIASTQDDDSLKALFEQAETMGLKEGDEYGKTLCALYESDPIKFLDTLAEMEKSVISAVEFYWTAGMELNELISLRASVEEASQNGKYTEIINRLTIKIEMIDSYSALESMPTVDTNGHYEFNVDVIRSFIVQNLQQPENHDEEFNRVIADAYETSPELLAIVISEYSEEEIERLSKSIASGYAASGKNPPDISYSQDGSETSKIIALIQSEIKNATTPPQTSTPSTAQPSEEQNAANYWLIFGGIAIAGILICAVVFFQRKRRI